MQSVARAIRTSVLSCAVAGALALPAFAWEPTRPVEITVPAGAGGASDQMARVIQSIVTKYKLMKEPMIIQLKGGASGAEGMMDVKARKPKPTNTAPGFIYMLCGAMQHSNTDPFDKTSPAIPIGPHWMILWPFDAKRCGLPNTVRDAGAWVMFDGTPYAYLHICDTPWVGTEYGPGQVAIWTMRYGRPLEK